MADDLVPIGEPPSFIDKLNLPRLIAGPAGEAISRLVAGAVDIPAAWMNQFAQGIRDKTEAKTVVSARVADAAANLAVNDPEIVQRAAYTLLSRQIRKQANREAIAKQTIEILEQEQAERPQETAQKVDDDWLNVFERFAEDASSERLQNLWAHILAGQLRRPHAFSLTTLRFVSELDVPTATLFEKYAPRIVNSDFIPYPPTSGVEFSELLRLEESNLTSGSGGTFRKIFDQPTDLSLGTKPTFCCLLTKSKLSTGSLRFCSLELAERYIPS